MEFSFRVDFGQVSGIILGLFIVGLAFNALTAWVERRGYMDGFTSLLVAAGVVLTLIPFIFISHFTLFILSGFVASGLPMIGGSIIRYIQQRERARREIARMQYGDESKRVAE